MPLKPLRRTIASTQGQISFRQAMRKETCASLYQYAPGAIVFHGAFPSFLKKKDPRARKKEAGRRQGAAGRKRHVNQSMRRLVD
jgi:hypothetical protein